MSSHSATAMGDQVFVYKLTKTSGWSVTSRDASIKQIKADTGTALGVSWSSNVVTLTNTMTADDMPMSSSDATTAKSAIDALNSKFTKVILFNTETNMSSGGTVQLSESADNFMFLAIYFAKTSGAGSSGRGILLIPMWNANITAFYPISVGNTLGSVRLNIGGTTFTVNEKSLSADLYLESVVGIIRV